MIFFPFGVGENVGWPIKRNNKKKCTLIFFAKARWPIIATRLGQLLHQTDKETQKIFANNEFRMPLFMSVKPCMADIIKD